MRTIYSIIFILAIPLFIVRLLWRGYRAPDYLKRWNERFSLKLPPASSKPLIWIHAVSFGEVEASRPLIAQLQEQFPQYQLLITTMTPTGSHRVHSLFKSNVLHCYLPYDFGFAVKRFLKACKPRLAIIMETELWPNLIHYAAKQQIPLVLANARLSERSLKGYQKYAAKIAHDMLQHFTVIAAQANDDRDRFIQLGASKGKVHTVGNLKFDLSLPVDLKQEAQLMRSLWGDRPVFIAASTHEGEDEIILNASRSMRSQLPDLLVILVPRHPERFDKVTALSQQAGFNTLRRTERKPCHSDIEVFVVDTMGELMLFYNSADIAFVGGSLIPRGGHNILEPIALGLPVLVGPHMFNFSDSSAQCKRANALIEIVDGQSLANKTIELLDTPALRQEMIDSGQQIMKQNQGASHRLFNLIKRQINDH